MRQLSTYLKHRAHWVLGSAAFLGVTLAHFITDPSWGQYAIAGNDIAYDIPWVLEMMREKNLVFFGTTAGYGGGHPGPVHLWLLSAGYALGAYPGAYLLFMIVNLLVWALAAVAMSKAMGTPWAGYGLILALAIADRMEWPMVSSSLTWLIGHTLAFSLLLASLAALFATPEKWSWSAPVALGAGLLSSAIYVTMAPLVIIPVIVGAWWLWRDREELGRAEKLTGVGLVLLVVIPLIIRWAQWGLSFPLDYSRSILRFRASNGGGGFGEAMSFHMADVWMGLNGAAAVIVWVTLLLIPLALSFYPPWRARAVRIFLVALVISFASLTVPSMDERHIAAIGTVLPKFGLAFAIGGVGLLLAKRLPERVVGISAITLAVIASILIARESAVHPRYFSSMQHNSAVHEAAAKLWGAVNSGPILRDEVIIMSDNPDLTTSESIGFLRPLRVELRRTGSDVCIPLPPINPGVGGPQSNEMRCAEGSNPSYSIIIRSGDAPLQAAVEQFDVNFNGGMLRVALVKNGA